MASTVNLIKGCIFFSFLFFQIAISEAASTAIPQFADNIHLGVATCAGSACHGSSEPFDTSTVLQNEYLTWQRHDKHSKAYKVLFNDRSKRIARNLGLKAAHTAKICLDCHTDNVAKDKRGRRFQLSDGIGCEACHGGAEKYLGPHVSGLATHQENIDNGLYPTENPIQRAKLCLSCHLGTNSQFATHDIMGAGHPRINFELDTYTATSPAHYKVDKDYRERKVVWSHARTWAVGQAMAVQQYLNLLTSPKRLKNGLFPELAVFECYACHQSMNGQRWQKRESSDIGPGNIRLQESNILMMKHIAKVIDPSLASSLHTKTLNLHQASTQSIPSIVSAAKELKVLNRQLINKIASTSFSSAIINKVLSSIINDGIKGNYFDYASAEQSLMAIEALATTLANARAIDFSSSSPLAKSIDKLYVLLVNDDNFSPSSFASELKQIQTNLSIK